MQLHGVDDEFGNYVGEVRYEGSFELKAEWYRYIVNVERKQFYDCERTAVRSCRESVFRDEPFPVLCTPYIDDITWSKGQLESWFGEVMAVTNERPGDDYLDITEAHFAESVPTSMTDEEIITFVTDGAPDSEAERDEYCTYKSTRLKELPY